ncbi:hypothetical protein WJX73_006674 [Symbiochloris irregularis]|uniref:glutamine--tRNA ligase n=1 Tax=Symbiochloris irregularis TaxID=706552 RepID=A0AAW1NUE8_9CHLO
MRDGDVTEEEAIDLFTRINLPEQKVKEAARSKKLRQELAAVILEAGISDCARSTGNLLQAVATKYPISARVHRPVVLRDYVVTDKISASKQLEAAFKYLEKQGDAPLDLTAFEQASGVGVVVSEAEVKDAVSSVLASAADQIQSQGHRINRNMLLSKVTLLQPWADGAVAKAQLDLALEERLGPKTAEDEQPVDKKKKKKEAKAALAAAAPSQPAPGATPPQAEPAAVSDPYAHLPAPQDNSGVHTTIPFSNGSTMHVTNSRAALAAHLEATGGCVVTRFPPEPNGYLHIGHAKAMFVSFGMAKHRGGRCFLRFDDTNPEAEKQEYIDHIRDIVSWMGWTPYKQTFSSDYFEELYQLAVKLIRSGNAYVDHQTAEEISAYREERRPSPWRERPMLESLQLFEDMRRGLIDEGKATLRMKMDPGNNNYNMFDLIAYRIKFAEHPHAGKGWVIYPSYDYTHCIVDALENITHSLCTLEFESRRASYFWLLDALQLYKPVVWEFARLSLTNSITSKRKLNDLVTGGTVKGWDDPRLVTLAGLRRRGVTPEGINAFCRELGITRSDSIVHLHKLDFHVRAHLDAVSPRCLAVLHPLRLVLTNLAPDYLHHVHGKVFPGRSEETYDLPLTRVVYMEQADFRESKSKDYYGLTLDQPAMLKYAGVITAKDVVRSSSGAVVEVQADFKPLEAGAKPPKGVLGWVGQPRPGVEPSSFEARLYEPLFRSPSPADLGDAWLDDLNPDSLTVVPGAVGPPRLTSAKVGDRFQLERIGFFYVDPDSTINDTSNRLVLNRTCTLRDSFPKAAAK